MSVLNALQTPEFQLGDFLLPWGMVIGAMGFLAAWLIVWELERRCWTRHIWDLPLFFVFLSVLLGCIFGLILAP